MPPPPGPPAPPPPLPPAPGVVSLGGSRPSTFMMLRRIMSSSRGGSVLSVGITTRSKSVNASSMVRRSSLMSQRQLLEPLASGGLIELRLIFEVLLVIGEGLAAIHGACAGRGCGSCRCVFAVTAFVRVVCVLGFVRVTLCDWRAVVGRGQNHFLGRAC